jgi:hypothetical protein
MGVCRRRRSNAKVDIPELDSSTRRELYDPARRRRLPGRSATSRVELLNALHGGNGRPKARSAVTGFADDAFQTVARERTRGPMVLPQLLTGNHRRLHVPETLREDHHTRIAQRTERTGAGAGAVRRER